MTKNNPYPMQMTKLFFLVLIVFIVIYMFSKGITKQSLNSTPAASETISSTSGLNQAQDQLDAVNIDSVDTGLNQLSSEANNF